MDHKPEDLIPILARLTNEYTSFESSSISYDTANDLMNGILYSLREVSDIKRNLPETKAGADVSLLYKKGQEVILKKVNRSKDTYNQLIKDYNAYGVKNYEDTIQKGLSTFFLRYDSKFKPQDHILTLDYPSLFPKSSLKGIDLIYYYTESIQKENMFLAFFHPVAIKNLLNSLTKDYENLYMDNLCYPVLFMVVFCFIADQPTDHLQISAEDIPVVEDFFDKKSPKEIEAYVTRIISSFCKTNGLDTSYFSKISKDFHLRYNGMLYLMGLEK